MRALLSALKGKKTHLIAMVALVLGLLQHFEVYAVPAEYWPIIGALGLSTLRAGIKNTLDDIQKGNQ